MNRLSLTLIYGLPYDILTNLNSKKCLYKFAICRTLYSLLFDKLALCICKIPKKYDEMSK